MAKTLSDRLSEAALGAFFGRADELQALTDAVRADEPPFAVAYIYGPGGIGKSSFLRAALDALPNDYLKLRLDCREIEPTADGALTAIAGVIGDTNDAIDIATLSQRLSNEARRTVIAFDTYETFGLLDTWIRQTLLPALPASVVTLIASREPPSPGWTTSPGWSGMFREIELHGLDQAQSLAMLGSRGLSEAQARRINEFTRGHPLALRACGGRRARASRPADRSGSDSSYSRASDRDAASWNRRAHRGGTGGRFNRPTDHRAVACSVAPGTSGARSVRRAPSPVIRVRAA